MRKQKKKYSDTNELLKKLDELRGKKFILDCGHVVTFGHNLGNNVMIYNDNKRFRCICSLCSY